MKKIRLYTDQALEIGSSCELEAAPSKHLLRVMRASEGDRCVLFNGDGSEYEAEITKAACPAVLSIVSKKNPNNESPLRVTLAQGVSRGERMDYVIQKSVECGVHKIIPVMTERCGVKLTPERMKKRRQHWQAVAMSACEQSGRCVLPVVELPVTLSELLDGVTGLKIVTDPLLSSSSGISIEPTPSCTILVGPEGGLSEKELKAVYGCGFIGLSLGPRILRTETAAVVALTALQMRWGDLNSDDTFRA